MSGLKLRMVLGVTIAVLVAGLAGRTTPARGADGGESGRLQFHGYGEIHYNNPKIDTMSPGAGNELDFHRFVLGWEYEYSDKVRVEGEIDYEHAARELELEEAYIEYDLSPTLALRVGSLLMPVGPLNEFHEPPLYYSVERPYVERFIIPTTWQENGAGFAGQAWRGKASYRAYVTAGMDATKITSLGGLHDVSSKGSESKADDLAGVGRVEIAPAAGLKLAGSAYYGGADQRTPGLGKVTMTLLGADARYRRAGFDLRGAYARVALDGADRVSVFVGGTVGSAMQGFYVEAAYDVLRRDRTEGLRSLVLFGRHEDFDTNEEIPAGFVRDPAAERTVSTAGVSYYPIEKVSFKADLEHWKDGADRKLNRVNLGAAFMF
ncbi:MAG: hypothetical protein E6K77_05960 [Candidatus Eisenbacteria bacterium]|uniref:Porin n=1 Tax=Eiseniibacteriota bacterium TaxID=2212470 RepID=A0A538THG6_UNCEI|nr:MAG: hypothetical protein E6K77_05960 [Candidatus Eisenbacteria bacterium]